MGGGGREHAMAWCIAKSAHIQKVYVMPGNGGTARDPRLENVAIDPARGPQAAADFVKTNDIALTVVGPEAPLAAGIVDVFQKENLPVLCNLVWSRREHFNLMVSIPLAQGLVYLVVMNNPV